MTFKTVKHLFLGLGLLISSSALFGAANDNIQQNIQPITLQEAQNELQEALLSSCTYGAIAGTLTSFASQMMHPQLELPLFGLLLAMEGYYVSKCAFDSRAVNYVIHLLRDNHLNPQLAINHTERQAILKKIKMCLGGYTTLLSDSMISVLTK